MCGICGVLDFKKNRINKELLKRMTASLSHRGPDDEGSYHLAPIYLGHRRLSIIDLSSAGHQPMSNEDGSVWLVFNGEIYDYQEQRESLVSRGHRLKSCTDCEIILHLYEEKGEDCLEGLNGMFSFALWDGKKERLFLARDRLGIKPMHYYWNGDFLVFGSEIKAILEVPDIQRSIDLRALDLYLTLNYIPAPYTIFSNIHKLPPASYIIGDRQGISLHNYWDIDEKNRSKESTLLGDPSKDHKSVLFNLLEDAVKRRMIADVPLGAFLSGGIDSSIIVALMARNSGMPIKTFSIGYKDLPSYDETSFAREVALMNKTDHYEFKLSYNDILEAFPKVLENIDEPFADSSAIPTYIVSRETRSKVKVALSGDGGDELFAGYRMYQGEYWAGHYMKIPYFFRQFLLRPIISSLPDARDKPGLEIVRRAKKFIRGMSHSFSDRFYRWREIFSYETRKKLMTNPPENNLYYRYIEHIVNTEKHKFPGDMINLMLYMDVKGLLHNDMLTKVDRMSMANSLEVRVPFLDHTVVEYTFGLHGHNKLKGRSGKYILLETFRNLLPASLHNRPKWGFEMPIGSWFRKELRFLVHEYLSREQFKRHDIFNYSIVKNLIDSHMKGRNDTSWHLWNLIVFQHWYNTYVY